jgi:hypothetical protein
VHAFVVALDVVGELVEGLASRFDSSSAAFSGKQSSSADESDGVAVESVGVVVESVDVVFASVEDVVTSAEGVLVSIETSGIVVVTAGVFAELTFDRGDTELGELAPPPDEPPAVTRTSAQLKNSSGVWPTAVHDF